MLTDARKAIEAAPMPTDDPSIPVHHAIIARRSAITQTLAAAILRFNKTPPLQTSFAFLRVKLKSKIQAPRTKHADGAMLRKADEKARLKSSVLHEDAPLLIFHSSGQDIDYACASASKVEKKREEDIEGQHRNTKYVCFIAWAEPKWCASAVLQYSDACVDCACPVAVLHAFHSSSTARRFEKYEKSCGSARNPGDL